ncbi:MAG: hypothetical protein ACE5HF_01735 [Gemmatimonadota bacterium]
MRKTRSTVRIALLSCLVAAAGLSACGGEAAEEDAQAAVDRELDLAAAGDSAQAALEDVTAETAEPAGPAAEPEAPPAARQPSRQSPPPAQPARQSPPPAAPARTPPPSPKPAAPRMQTLTAAAGTAFTVTLDQELSTKNNQVGDLFTTTLQTPITDGTHVIVPAGAKIRGEVTAVQVSGKGGQPAVLKVAFNEVSFEGDTYPIQATILEANPTTKGRKSTGEKVGTIGGGAVAGAILGRVIGGNKTGTLIGAAVGAAAGTAITLGGDVDAVLAQGSEMRLELDGPLVVQRPM